MVFTKNKYIIICLLLSGCIKEGKTVTYTFDAAKDTSFIVERYGDGPAVIMNIDGYLSDSAEIYVFYHNKDYEKHNTDTTQNIGSIVLPSILNPGKVHIAQYIVDFFQDEATIKYNHRNNKKGKLKVSASL